MATPPDTTTMMSIAVIDDDPGCLQLMEDVLQMQGYHTIVPTKGEDAYNLILRKHPDLIILDIRMNQDALSGWHILERIWADHIVDHTPVIVCTADIFFLRKMSARLLLYGYQVLEKPFDIRELEACIAKAFRTT
ncbi:MAG TPA: response regulator [Chloroflexia bacterium]|nr:response regulator [Chloroflexia bacterium]